VGSFKNTTEEVMVVSSERKWNGVSPYNSTLQSHPGVSMLDSFLRVCQRGYCKHLYLDEEGTSRSVWTGGKAEEVQGFHLP